jgi:hypothetical protein
MKIEAIGAIRENIVKDRGWYQVELRSVEDRGGRILFSGAHSKGAFVGKADRDGGVIELRLCSLGLSQAEKRERLKGILENSGYRFEHPTLILEGTEGWFTILTPNRQPYQAIVHWDGSQADFFATVPELLAFPEIENEKES